MTGVTDRPFANLSPDAVLAAVEALGIQCDGRLFALNSYENRVYQVGSTDHGSLVCKFYRPGRWSDAQILEEHAFALELAAAELPVVAPQAFDGRTLQHCDGLRYAVFPRRSARAAELDVRGSLELVGRSLGRLHAIGARDRFAVRPVLGIERLGWQARELLLGSELLDESIAARYEEVSRELLEAIDAAWTGFGPVSMIRIHGDCHLGNVLWDEHGPVFVDLDDCMRGPRIQDLWMFIAGSPDERRGQWNELAGGYRQFADLDEAEIALIEPLRALRMIQHNAWIAARWNDPAFPRAFPWFTSPGYWQEHLSDLWQQIEAIAAPPMALP
ncbi:MAG: serine/threonine protein kinase [Steroidobacteraceae bacterium]|nr:serine/threonine protein kinase [Nevskiaceae bacterium]MCP5339605.1 serine/threonine protein kinase [Nevskiaceae bacterium]MCP5472937.1 serine/threonine protein kinase [Nevskiaceae bacterium]